jgi:hypothetical protein
VREIGATRLPAQKTARPQLTLYGTPAEGKVNEDENGEASVAVTAAAAATAAAGAMVQTVEVITTRHRWISALPVRPSPDAPPGDKIFLSFSVPASLVPDQSAAPDVDAD